jgi:hypothetical protein
MLLFPSVSRLALDAVSAFYLMGTRVSIIRDKVTLTSSGAVIINAWSYIYRPPYAFTASLLMKQSDN